MGISIYLASSFKDQERIHEYSLKLRDKGYEVTSIWHTGKFNFIDLKDYELGLACAAVDLHGIDKANYFFCFLDIPSTGGGRHVELGYALAKNKQIRLIGEEHTERRNVFQLMVAPYHKFVSFEQILGYEANNFSSHFK